MQQKLRYVFSALEIEMRGRKQCCGGEGNGGSGWRTWCLIFDSGGERKFGPVKLGSLSMDTEVIGNIT